MDLHNLPPGMEQLPPAAGDPYAECRILITVVEEDPEAVMVLTQNALLVGAEAAIKWFAKDFRHDFDAGKLPAEVEPIFFKQLQSPAFACWLRAKIGAL